MHLKFLVLFTFLSFTTSLLSSTITFDIRSSASNITLIPDSIVVYNKSENFYFKFTKTSIVDFNIITSVNDIPLTSDQTKYIRIYTYNGQLIATNSNVKGTYNSVISEMFSNLENGIYFIETVSSNDIINKDIVYFDANLNHLKTSKTTLNFLLEPVYDITIYKHGYKSFKLDNIKVESNENIPVLLLTEYNKYYKYVTVNVNGIWKEGKVNSEVTIDGNVKYSNYENKKELNEKMVFNNSELRILDDVCYDKVMDGINQKLECVVDFPISNDSLYLCDLECVNQNNSYSELHANSIYLIFKDSYDSLDFFNFHFRKGSYEYGGSYSKKQQYMSVDIALSNIPIEEDSEKYTITLNNSQIKKYISFFYWDEYYDGIDLHPPFNRGKLKSNYNGELDIKSDAKIEITIYKSE